MCHTFSWSQKVDNAAFDSRFVADDVASEKYRNSAKSSQQKVILLRVKSKCRSNICFIVKCYCKNYFLDQQDVIVTNYIQNV